MLINWLQPCEHKINYYGLSQNPSPLAIPLLEKNIDKVDWFALSSNPNAISILEKNLNKVDWSELCYNINAIPIIENYINNTYNDSKSHYSIYWDNHIDWEMLSSNPSAVNIIENNFETIKNVTIYSYYSHAWEWSGLCMNTNPKVVRMVDEDINGFDYINWVYLSSNPSAIYILEENLDKVNWEELSTNPNAIPIIEKNLDKVNWTRLSCNKNPEALRIFEKNLDKVDWKCISANPNPEIIPLLKRNLDKIYWNNLAQNPIGISVIKHVLNNTLTNILRKNLWSNISNECILDNLAYIDWFYLSMNPKIFKVKHN